MKNDAWWTRLVMRLLPRRFRDRFGAELLETCHALADDAGGQGGPMRRLAYVGRELLALLRLSLSLSRERSAGAVPGGRRMTEALAGDLRWAIRYARRRPALTLATVATISLSVAAATTAFGLASAVLWRPLPFASAGALRFVWEAVERDGHVRPARVTAARYSAWRDAAADVASLSMFGAAGFTIDTPTGATTIRGVRVSVDFFDTLGIGAMLGRTFAADEEHPGRHKVIVLSQALWQEHFGGRPDLLGSSIRLSGEPYTVIGVMPPATYPGWAVNPADVTLDPESRRFWVPIARTPDLQGSARAHVLGVVARLKPGRTDDDLLARLNGSQGTTGADPHRAHLQPFRQQFVADARTPLLALAATALAVLLIACANLAALQASAFESRRTELSMRLAIGAGAWQLVRQIVFETALLIAAGTCVGLALARAGLAYIPGRLPPTVPFLTTPAIEGRAVAFAVILGLVATFIVSCWPVARVILSPPSPRGTAPRPRAAVYRVLVIAQVAIAVALTSAAGLLGRSLQTVERQDPGFALDGVLVAGVNLPQARPQDAARTAAAETALLAAIAARPRVDAVAAAYDHPLEANWSENPTVLGDTTAASQQTAVDLRIVTPGYFEALSVQLLDGRTLTDRDTLDAPGAVVINEAFARQLGGRVIGRRLRTSTPSAMFPGAPNEFAIVGVVANERFRGLELPAQPAYYLGTRQFPQASLTLLVKSADPLAIAPDVRATIRSLDPSITVDRATTLETILGEQLVSRRVTTDVIGIFALIALGLAASGVHGLLMVAVRSSRRDIGIRLAVGASPGSIARRILGYGLQNAAAGVLAGCILALGTGRLLQSLLVDVSVTDPRLLAIAAVVLLATAAGAALLPALRAARVDPLQALREE